VLFLVEEAAREELPRSLVSLLESDPDPLREDPQRPAFTLELDPKLLGHVLPDRHRPHPLHVGDALEEQDPVHDPLRVLHLFEGDVPEALRQSPVAPVLAHLRVQEVLIDDGQLQGQQIVERVRNPAVPLHPRSLLPRRASR
jgi:hypothetical protein